MTALLGLLLWLATRAMMPLAPLPTIVYDPTLNGADGSGGEEPPPPGDGAMLDLGTDDGVTLALSIGII